jgi:hypothetical protein
MSQLLGLILPLARRQAPALALAGLAVASGAPAFAAGPSQPEGGLAQADVGLSAVSAQHFENPTFGPLPAAAFELWGEVLAVGDFNGDGADDLAAGTPDDNGLAAGGPAEAGSVTIRYGAPRARASRGGLHDGPPDAVFLQSSLLDLPEAGDHFARSLASCDFNRDGFDDLAIGIPDEDTGGDTDAGAVEIHHGSATGLQTAATRMLVQESPGFPVLPVVPLQFGIALACGDFDGDSFPDLAIGSPNSSPAAALTGAGLVFVAAGSATGLLTTGSYVLHEDTPDMPGLAEDFDQFGFALAAGNFNGDLFADLAIGSPGETISNQPQAGAIHMLVGGVGGLQPQNSAFLGDTSVGGLSEPGDQFAYALAVADFDGDGRDDVAIGIPTETLATVESTGQVLVLYGQVAAPALDLTRPEFFDQDAVYGHGANQAADFFGQVLAAGDFDGDGDADLAIGHPGEAIAHTEDGAMTVVMGHSLGLDLLRSRGFGGGIEGLPGNSQEGDRNFANGLAAGDFDGDGHADLAISSPRSDVGALTNAGAVTVLYGGLFSDGFETHGLHYWSDAILGNLAPEKKR